MYNTDSQNDVTEPRFGRIKEISGPVGSGLLQVYFDDGSLCHIESGYGVRTIAQCYGSLHEAKGKVIGYYTDSFNMMVCFEPVDD